MQANDQSILNMIFVDSGSGDCICLLHLHLCATVVALWLRHVGGRLADLQWYGIDAALWLPIRLGGVGGWLRPLHFVSPHSSIVGRHLACLVLELFSITE